MLGRFMCRIGLHHYTPWRAHEPPCVFENATHYTRRCHRPGCEGGPWHRRHRLVEEN